jgi:uncharacterized protein YegP (UPF0339 family)
MDTWEFFQDSKGSWRWRCISADGNVVLNSAEVYPRRVQAVADAITHGFVEGGTDLAGHRETQKVGATDQLRALKVKYESAYASYESRLAVISSKAVSADSLVLREDIAKALQELECARREYREALLQTAFGGTDSES